MANHEKIPVTQGNDESAERNALRDAKVDEFGWNAIRNANKEKSGFENQTGADGSIVGEETVITPADPEDSGAGASPDSAHAPDPATVAYQGSSGSTPSSAGGHEGAPHVATPPSGGEGSTGSGAPDTSPSPESASSPQTGSPEDPDATTGGSQNNPNNPSPSPESSNSATSSTGKPEGNPSTPNSNSDEAAKNKAPLNLEAREVDESMRNLLENDEGVANLVTLVNSASRPEANDAQRDSARKQLETYRRMVKASIDSDIAHTDDADSGSEEIKKLEDKKDAMLRFSERAKFALDNGFKITDQILVLTPDELKEQRAIGSDLQKERLELEERLRRYKENKRNFGELLGQDTSAKSGKEGSENTGNDAEIDKSKPYFEAVERYAVLRAKREYKGEGGLFTRWVRRVTGKEDRDLQELYEAEKNMKEKVIAYAVEQGKTPDEAYDILRNVLDKDVRKQTDLALVEKVDSSGVFSRFAAKIGSWVNKGDRLIDKAKAGAAGFVTGAFRGAVVAALGAALGVSVPFSTAVGVGVAVASSGALRKGIRIDEIKSRVDGNSDGILNDDEFSKIRKEAKSSGENADGTRNPGELEKVADSILNKTRDVREQEISNAVNERMRDKRVPLAIGRAAGGLLGGLFGSWAGSHVHDAFAGGNEVHASAPTDPGNNGAPDPKIGRQVGSGINEIAKADTTDFSQYEYPWDWAVEKFGENNAIGELERRVEALRQAGHDVEWHGEDTRRWLSVDGGVSDTRSVLELLANSDV